MTESETATRVICACGKKIRIPTTAANLSRKGKCPACGALFQYIDGHWSSLKPDLENGDPSVSQQRTGVTQDTQMNGKPRTTSHLPNGIPSRDLGLTQVNAGDSDTTSKLREVNATISTLAPSPSPTGGTPAQEPNSNTQTNPNQGETQSLTSLNVATFSSLERDNHTQETLDDCGAADLEGGLLSNDAIRCSIIRCLRLGCEYDSEVAAAIALACHPWPNRDIGSRLTDMIAAEMLPSFNINHPSIREIAADRLLRIAEVVALDGRDSQLLPTFTRAAHLLAGGDRLPNRTINTLTQETSCSRIVASPWGFSNLPGSTNERNLEVGKTPATDHMDDSQLHAVIHELTSGSGKHRSRDIGLICGENPIGVTIDVLASHLEIELPEAGFDNFLDGLSSRKLDILITRTLKLHNPDTLIVVADRWSVTRERVRQIESRLEENLQNEFADTFNKIGRNLFSPFQSRIARFSEIYEVAFALARKSRYKSELATYFLRLFGPWNTKEGWAIHCSIADEVSTLRNKLTLKADQYGFLDREQIERVCENLFFTDEERNQYLIEVLGLGFSCGNWMSKQTLRCEVASALKRIGRPATKEEIADLLGHPAQSIGSLLGNLDGVVRADLYRWGFSEWIEDVYDGIVGEINQRIDDYNGFVPVHTLLTEIPSQFGVAEGSVRSYLASSAFVVENDMVRRANNEEYVPRNPETCKDAVRVGNRWACKTRVHDRHLNGYSLGVNFDIAFANGLRPGDDLVVPIKTRDYDVSLIWRPHNLNRLVDVGRISKYLTYEGYKPGDFIIILPTRESVMIFSESEYAELTTKTGAESVDEQGEHMGRMDRNNVSDPLLDLLGEP